MRLLLLLFAPVLLAEHPQVRLFTPTAEKLTALDRAQLDLADAKIRQAESEYQKALALKQILIMQLCERVDAPVSRCTIDVTANEIKQKPPVAPARSEK